jgi:hypothetical protein
MRQIFHTNITTTFAESRASPIVTAMKEVLHAVERTKRRPKMSRILALQKLNVREFDDLTEKGCSSTSGGVAGIGRCSSCSIACISQENAFQGQ